MIAERATALVHQFSREQVLLRAHGALGRVGTTPVDELVPGEDVAWLLAAALVRQRVNGTPGPRVVTRVMDDGLQLDDGIG